MDKRKKREFCHKQERNCQHILCLSAVVVFSPNTPSDLESAGELSHSLEVSSVNSIAKEKPWDKAQFHLGRRRKERDSWNQPSDSPFDDSLKLGRTLWDDSEVTPRPPEIKKYSFISGSFWLNIFILILYLPCSCPVKHEPDKNKII